MFYSSKYSTSFSSRAEYPSCLVFFFLLSGCLQFGSGKVTLKNPLLTESQIEGQAPGVSSTSSELSLAPIATHQSDFIHLPQGLMDLVPGLVREVEVFLPREMKMIGNSLVYASHQGLFVSNNQGQNWALRHNRNGLNLDVYSALSVGGHLLVGGRTGLFLSKDQGVSFTSVATPFPDARASFPTITQLVSFGAKAYAVSYTTSGTSGLLVSADAGETFTHRTAQDLPGFCPVSVYAMISTADRLVAACFGAGTTGPLSIVSSLDGVNWTSSTLPTLPVDPNTNYFDPRNWKHFFRSSGNLVVLVAGNELLVSLDQGKTFVSRTPPVSSFGIRDMVISGGKIYASRGSAGVFISSDNGVTFVAKSAPTPADGSAAVVERLSLGKIAGEIYYTGVTGRLFLTTNDFQTGTLRSGGGSYLVDGRSNFLHPAGDTLFVATTGGAFYSTNGGASFQTPPFRVVLNNDATFDPTTANRMSTAVLVGTRLMVATENGLFWTDAFNPADANENRTWVRRTTLQGLGAGAVRCANQAANFVFACTEGGLSISSDSGATFTTVAPPTGATVNRFTASGFLQMIATTAGLQRTLDGGATYQTLSGVTNLGLATNVFYDVKLLSNQQIYAMTDTGFARTSDQGATWQRPTIRRNGVVIPMSSVGISRGAAILGNRIYIGTEVGLAVSIDAGVTFHILSAGFDQPGNNPVSIFDIQTNGTSLYLATDRGLYRMLRETAIVQ